MYKNILHSIISVWLVVVFQLPMLLQLVHNTHEHEEIKVCNAQGSERHIHKTSNNSCIFLHKTVNPELQVVFFDFQQSIFNSFFKSIDTQEITFNKQRIPFASLRAPPTPIV